MWVCRWVLYSRSAPKPMGRSRKSGRALSGWVIIDKPAGITSTAVVNKVRWAFDAQKAGHAGTLDPDATGLLAVALGEATKTIPFIMDAQKSYDFEMAFGSATHTDDASGDIIATSTVIPTKDDILSKLPGFRGDILQVPPQVSAVKVDGARAYDLARDGFEMDLAARALRVHALDLTAFAAPNARLKLTCGKGGYVRAIARDLGEALGSKAHVLWLKRTHSGPFDLNIATGYTAIEAAAKSLEIDRFLHPLELGLSGLKELPIPDHAVAKLRNGNPCGANGSAEFGETVWASYHGKAIAIGTYKAGHIHPTRVILQQ